MQILVHFLCKVISEKRQQFFKTQWKLIKKRYVDLLGSVRFNYWNLITYILARKDFHFKAQWTNFSGKLDSIVLLLRTTWMHLGLGFRQSVKWFDERQYLHSETEILRGQKLRLFMKEKARAFSFTVLVLSYWFSNGKSVDSSVVNVPGDATPLGVNFFRTSSRVKGIYFGHHSPDKGYFLVIYVWWQPGFKIHI